MVRYQEKAYLAFHEWEILGIIFLLQRPQSQIILLHSLMIQKMRIFILIFTPLNHSFLLTIPLLLHLLALSVALKLNFLVLHQKIEIHGPRRWQPPARFVPGQPEFTAPIPPVEPEGVPDENPEVAEHVAMVYVATVHAQGSSEPRTLKEALHGPDAAEWKKAIDAELSALLGMGTFEFISKLPEGRRAISSKLVFKIKRLTNGDIERFKARLVA